MQRILEENRAIQRLTDTMQYKLKLNRNKGGWADTSNAVLLDRIKAEVFELEESLIDGDISNAIIECADIANFCAMLADNLIEGYFGTPGVEAPPKVG